MNKRQAKKKYKKMHGCNPASKKKKNNSESIIHITIQRITDVFKEFLKEWKIVLNRIQTMSEEEFESYLNGLTPEQRGIALRIRNRL